MPKDDPQAMSTNEAPYKFSIPDFRYSQSAEHLGFKGIFVDRPDQVAQAWQAAFAADRPVVVEAYTDPEVPPLPPHITLKQAQAFASTLIKGDPREWRVIQETAKELVADLMPQPELTTDLRSPDSQTS